MIWLPYAFRSGIRMKRLGETEFTAELPFRRFNRNWYNAMAGASLLANSEIAMEAAPDRWRFVLERPVLAPP